MFEDIHALVEFAEAGSIARAANRLHRTPSAITRQMQRLEAELGAQLLDRSVKPPRLTQLGIRIVERSRDVPKRVDDLRALAAKDAEPAGPFRIEKCRDVSSIANEAVRRRSLESLEIDFTCPYSAIQRSQGS